MDQNEASAIIGQNSVASPQYSSNSFVGRLHEEAIWDHFLFHQLSDAANVLAAGKVSRDIRGMAFEIYSYVVGVSLLAHVNPNDGFKIGNLSMEEFYEVREEVEVAFQKLLGFRRFG